MYLLVACTSGNWRLWFRVDKRMGIVQFYPPNGAGCLAFMWHPVAKSASLPVWANPLSGSFTGLRGVTRMKIFITGCGLGAPEVKKTMGQPE